MHCHNDLEWLKRSPARGAQGTIEAGVDCLYKYNIKWLRRALRQLRSRIDHSCTQFLARVKQKVQFDENIDLKKSWKIARYASYALDSDTNQSTGCGIKRLCA